MRGFRPHHGLAAGRSLPEVVVKWDGEVIVTKGGVRDLAFTPSRPGGPCRGCPRPGRSPSRTHQRRPAAACGSSSSWDGVAAGAAQQDGQQQHEGPGPRHVPSASHAHIAEFTACSHFLPFFLICSWSKFTLIILPQLRCGSEHLERNELARSTWWKSSGGGWWWRLHSTVNALNAAARCTLRR